MSVFRPGGLLLVVISLLVGSLPAAARARDQAGDPPPHTPIKHFIVLMQRSLVRQLLRAIRRSRRHPRRDLYAPRSTDPQHTGSA